MKGPSFLRKREIPARTGILAGLELGSRQFTAAVGRLREQRLVLEAVESVPSRGFEREGLSDPVECADAVARLIRQVERNGSFRVSSAAVAFPGNHLKSFNASASIPVPEPGVGITRQDVEQAVNTCRSLSLEYDRQVIHSFERGFAVDGQSGIRNPVGLAGKKLTVELHLVTALGHTAQNLSRVLSRAGLEVEGFLMPALGAAEAVLPDLDRDLGVILIRIGDFHTEAVLFNDGQVRETFLAPGGAEDLIESLSRNLKLPRVAAEHLLGQVRTLEEQPALVSADGPAAAAGSRADWASLPLRAGTASSARSFPQGQVVQLVRTRLKELLQRIHRRLSASPLFLDCASGIVMVGHWTRLDGFLEMVEEGMNMPVRLGTVKEVEVAPGLNLSSRDVAAIGLLRHSAKARAAAGNAPPRRPWLKPFEKVQRLLQDYF